MSESEIWKDVVGYEGFYKVSNKGNVYSVGRKDTIGRKCGGRILRPRKHKHGYFHLALHKDGIRKNKLIHRLVAEAFLPNPNNFSEVNHLDENKTNNELSNLEWCDTKHNVNYGTRNTRVSQKLSKKVKAINIKTGEVLTFSSTIETGNKGYSRASVSQACRGVFKSSKGKLIGGGMKGILKGSSLAGGTPVRGRVENDYYATPLESTQALLNVLELNGSILEPACGEGHISEVLKSNYPNSEIVSTDLIDRGYGEGGIDFLEHDYTRRFNNIITNPPFKYMREFTETALEIADEKVVMFGKIQFLEGKGRREFLMNSPLKYVYVFSERQNPLRNGKSVDENDKKWSSTMCFAWYVWEKGYQGEPIVRWL